MPPRDGPSSRGRVAGPLQVVLIILVIVKRRTIEPAADGTGPHAQAAHARPALTAIEHTLRRAGTDQPVPARRRTPADSKTAAISDNSSIGDNCAPFHGPTANS